MNMKGVRNPKGTTTLALALAAFLAALTAAGEQAVERERALAVQRRAIAIGERLDAAKTQEEKDAAWAELAALPSIPGGYPLARDVPKESMAPDGLHLTGSYVDPFSFTAVHPIPPVSTPVWR